MTAPHTNIRVIRRSRHRPKPGDIFAMQLPDETYLFGRVILTDLPLERAPMPGCNLIYVYKFRSADKDVDPDVLTPDQLLISPLFINRMPWTRGYFEHVAYRELREQDVLRQHCFLRSNGDYLDDHKRKLPGPIEPCGDWGLNSYRTLDDQVSDAVGIPRVPED